MKRIFLSLTFLAAGGCATCEQHPVWCAVGTAVIVGSIAVAVEHHHGQQQSDICKRVEPDGRQNGIVGCAGR